MTITISHSQLLGMLACELDVAKQQLEQLGLALTINPTTASAHIRELQALDHVSQRCASVAEILRADDISAATSAASLESIALRLHRSGSGLEPTPALESSDGDIEWY